MKGQASATVASDPKHSDATGCLPTHFKKSYLFLATPLAIHSTSNVSIISNALGIMQNTKTENYSSVHASREDDVQQGAAGCSQTGSLLRRQC